MLQGKYPLKHLLALLFALCLWGLSFPAMKLAINSNPPLALLFWRYLFSFLLVLVIFVYRFRGDIKPLLAHKGVFWLGLFNFCGSLLQFIGMAHTSSAKSAILTQLMIVLVPLFAYFLLRERVSRAQLAGIVLSLAGAVVLSTNLDFSGLGRRGTVFGDALTVLAVIFWALFIVFTRRLTQQTGTFWLLLGNVWLTCGLSTAAVLVVRPPAINSTGLLVALFLAVFCTILPTLLYSQALRLIDATTSAVIGPVEIISAVLVSYLLLHEKLTWIGAAGALLILLSVYIVDLPLGRRNRS